MVSPLWWPEEREDQLGWAPGSLSNDSWAESGDLALRELPTDICLLFARTGTLEGEIMPWDLTLSGQDKVFGRELQKHRFLTMS